MVDIKQLETLYFQINKPVPYNLKCGKEILIHPILVEHWAVFEASLPILRIEKNDINDIKIIQMSYLEFIYHIIENSDKDDKYGMMLANILSGSLKTEKVGLDKIDDKINIISIDGEYNITSAEFEDIKKIILYQNIIDYDDRYMSADVRKAVQDYHNIKYKDISSPTLEKKKIFIMSKNGTTEERINKMYYRTFSQIFKTLVDNDIYFANKMMETSPKYEIKDKIVHPMFAKDIDKLDEAFTSKEGLENKIQGAN